LGRAAGVLTTLITLYGIKNCDTVKKARKWLEERGIEYTFHDFREDGLVEDQVRAWLAEIDWQELINRRSTSWKALDRATRDNMNADRALTAILQQPTLIKRPLLDTGRQRFIGFSAERYDSIFSHHTL
jgi:Spx/MgsR family transcriptional regulator